jgi:hypothetical protein
MNESSLFPGYTLRYRFGRNLQYGVSAVVRNWRWFGLPEIGHVQDTLCQT